MSEARAYAVDRFVDLPQVGRAQDAAHEAERTIARYLVRLYENPPSR